MAGRIPEKFIDDLLARTDIVDVIDARVPLRKAGRDYKACCPFHDEKTPSFTVSPDKQFYHCFGCGAHGSAIGFLMEYEHMSFPEAVAELAGRAGMEVPKTAGAGEPQAAPDETARLLEILQRADRVYRRLLREHPQAREAVDYLKGRGLSGEIAADFGLGFAPEGWDLLQRELGGDTATRDLLLAAGLITKKDGGGYYDRFRHRVMFPIHDYRGRVVGFGGRVLGSGEPKYLNSPETALFHKGRELYGLFRARDALKRVQRAVVVEGYMDVVALAQFGIDYAVATLGTATTRDHLERLFRYVPEVVFCFDGDRAGREAAWRALENALPVLHDGRQVSFLFLPDGEDPDTLVRKEGAEAFGQRLSGARPLPEYFFQHLGEQVDLGRLDGRARLAELAKPHLARLPAGVLKELMLGQLAELSRVDAAKLSTLMQQAPGRADARLPPRPAGAPRRPGGATPVSPLLKTVIALLIQHPRLAGVVDEVEEFAGWERPGAGLLVALCRLLKERPQLSTGAILEHFRDSEHQHALARLAVWDHPMLTQDVEAEFRDSLRQLRRMANGELTEQLYSRDRLTGLTETEKAELKRLLAERVRLQGV